MSNRKPTIPNGTFFNGYIIQYRMNDNENIEVYLLNDMQFLYLIRDMKEIISTSYPIEETTLGYKKYYYFVTTEYIDDLKRLWTELTELKGFALVAGMDQVKQELYKNVVFPVQNPEKYARFKVSIPNGILLYGPPGCGKTYIVEKLAEEINYNFIKVDHSDIASPYIHDSVIKISKLFERAKKLAPCILFLDEIEALMPDRSSAGENAQYKRDETNEFLMKLNNAGQDKILVIGATNNMELMDPAVLRSGRFDEKIYVSAPDLEARVSLFKLALKDRPLAKDIDYEKLAKATDNYACSDIIHIVEESARCAIVNDKEHLSMELILSTIDNNPSSISSEEKKNSIGFLRNLS